MKFDIICKDAGSGARAGSLHTDHGTIETPVFMPVGTQGTVKAVDQQKLKEEVKARIILGNTYHLFLRPGMQVLKEAGGLHKFMNWDRPILTDSGGYQVYSLAANRKLKEDGVEFRSHIDGRKLMFTPENVIDTQRLIGADIIMAFDECTPWPCEKKYAENSMHLTHRWLQRCVEHFKETEGLYGYDQTLFPIVQGSTYPDLRKASAEFISGVKADGNAIGGLSVGEPHDEMYAMTEMVCSILPSDKPRYLMGVGTPVNILECIALGVDMFDCVMPTRNARNGMLFTANGTINIRNKKWENDFNPIDDELTPHYSKAYLRHLFIAKEYLAAQIASVHNLKFYLWLVDTARTKITEGTFAEWKNRMVKVLDQRL
ncbi:MAG: tRNA guanosine(34) transglycosylase Tgt [Flavobacteriales bacterium]|nr:tRNA guanosine(34) transglycosylase Tgt [Flavobacteriales bacterium]